MSIDVNELRADDYEQVLTLCREIGQTPPELRTPHSFVHLLRKTVGLSLAARDDGRVIGAVLCRFTKGGGHVHELIVPESVGDPQLAKLLADKAISKLFASGAHKGHINFPPNPITAELWNAVQWTAKADSSSDIASDIS